jgi:tetratricopeptide (TPR) repeat protein
MLEQIEKYLNNELSLSERQDFENQLTTDSALVKNVAFYVNTRMAAKELAIEKRKGEFEQLRKEIQARPIRKVKPFIWVSGIAASVLLAIGIWWFTKPSSLTSGVLADTYIQEHFENLPVKMDANADSLQMGLQLFNEQKLSEANAIFEDILQRKTKDSDALKYAGIANLRLKNYDKAIQYFHNLSQQTNLYSNPGKFYEALALLKQSPANSPKAIDLFGEVINNNLEGNEEARKFVTFGIE